MCKAAIVDQQSPLWKSLGWQYDTLVVLGYELIPPLSKYSSSTLQILRKEHNHFRVFWCFGYGFVHTGMCFGVPTFSWRIFWFEYLLACQSLYLTYYLTPVWVASSVRLGLGEALCTILNACFYSIFACYIFLFEN